NYLAASPVGFLQPLPKTWVHWVPWAELWYNSTFYVSTGVTPFEAVYGRKPHLLVRYTQGETKVAAVSEELREWVFLKLRPHHQQTVARRINQKLAPRFFGPFPVVEKIGVVSYKLKLPDDARVHPIFHISQLKKAIGNYTVEPKLPEGMEIEPEECESPEQLLTSREVVVVGQVVKQWLVKWKGRAEEDTT
ncbi:hypothetical protein L195_g025155, partial [Trifolium pratense]